MSSSRRWWRKPLVPILGPIFLLLVHLAMYVLDRVDLFVQVGKGTAQRTRPPRMKAHQEGSNALVMERMAAGGNEEGL